MSLFVEQRIVQSGGKVPRRRSEAFDGLTRTVLGENFLSLRLWCEAVRQGVRSSIEPKLQAAGLDGGVRTSILPSNNKEGRWRASLCTYWFLASTIERLGKNS